MEPGSGHYRCARQWWSVVGGWPVTKWGSAAHEPLRKLTQHGKQRRVGETGVRVPALSISVATEVTACGIGVRLMHGVQLT